jgi:hypothetical protein
MSRRSHHVNIRDSISSTKDMEKRQSVKPFQMTLRQYDDRKAKFGMQLSNLTAQKHQSKSSKQLLCCNKSFNLSKPKLKQQS